jgi:hypothetical protein
VPRRPESSDYYGGRDPVLGDVAIDVVRRQRGVCLARIVDALADECRGRMQLDHVKDVPQVGEPVVKRGPSRRRRYRAPSDRAHLVAVCEHHHLDGWATSRRPEIRRWLRYADDDVP